MVRKGLSPLPKSIADLKKLKLCAQAGTTGATYIKTKIKPSQGALPEHHLDHVPAAASRSSATSPSTTSRSSVPSPRRSRASIGPIVGRLVTHEQYGIVFQKGSKLRAVVNPVLKGLIKDGTVGKLTKKWLTVNFADLPSFK